MSNAVSPPAPIDPMALPDRRKFLIFGVMAFGQFMALIDIQIVAASLNDVQAGLSDLVIAVHGVRHEAAGVDELAMAPDRGDPLPGREVDEDLLVLVGQDARGTEHRVGPFLGHRQKGALELTRFEHFERLQD